VDEGLVDVGAVFGSLQPNQPGVSHVEVELVEVLVAVGIVELDLLVVVTSSLQPNHPGVLQVEVDVVVKLLVDVEPVVVVSSRHPHHPGVWQVAVRVLVFVLVDVDGGVVAVLLLLPVTSFQRGQS